MKNTFKAFLVWIIVAVILATSFVVPVSAATVDDDSSVSVVFNDQRKRSYDKRVALVCSEFPDGKTFSGTAFIISNNALVTAAHCVCNTDTFSKAKKVMVYPGGDMNDGYTVKNFICYNDSPLKKDCAILEINEKFGDKYGYFDFDTEVTTNDTLTVTGFPSDKKAGGKYYQYTESDKAISIDSNYINHKISAVEGNSGGPTYKTVNGKDVVVGILTSGSNIENNSTRIDTELYNNMNNIRKNHFFVKYEANGGYGFMNDTLVATGNATPLKKNTLIKYNGTKFAGWTAYRESDKKWFYKDPKTGKEKGWFTTQEASKMGLEKYVYRDEQRVANTSSDSDIVHMYAQWGGSSKYSIEYKANGGSGSMSTTTATYGTSTKLSANTFTKGSREFLGWTAYRESDNTHLYDNPNNPSKPEWLVIGSATAGKKEHIFKDGESVSNLSGINNDCITMTAQWGSPTACTIYYDANGGNGEMATTVIKYSSVSDNLRKNIFTKDTYIFAGWTVNKTKSSRYDYWLYENSENPSEQKWLKEGEQPTGWTKHIYKDGDLFTANSSDDLYKITMYAEWVLKGDVNSDGIFNINDVTIVQRYLAKFSVDNFNYVAADFDGNGKINILDITAMQACLAK